jgi:hypothetical protein
MGSFQRDFFLFWEKEKSQKKRNQASMAENSHAILWSKISLPKVLFGKARHDAKSTCLMKHFVLSAKCTAAHVPDLKEDIFVDCFRGTNSYWIIILI